MGLFNKIKQLFTKKIDEFETDSSKLIQTTKSEDSDHIQELRKIVERYGEKSYVTEEGEVTSRSPSRRWETEPLPGETKSQTTKRELDKKLALEGTTSDYHFAIANACNIMWSYRKEEPWVIKEIEKYFLKGLELIENDPKSIMFDDKFPRIELFDRLIMLYEREGYIEDAVKLAKKSVEFQQSEERLHKLQEKLNAIHDEDK